MNDIKYIRKILKKFDEKVLNKNNMPNINKEFFIILCNDKNKLEFFLKYIKYFYEKKNNFKKIGLDFEFTERKIALIQISLFDENYNVIFLLNPKDLNKNQEKIFIKYIFVSDISRILHGSDSLDYPYICDILLKGSINKIYLFTKKLIDTRFMCEYIKIKKNFKDEKCSIYDALIYFNVINKDIYKKLTNINENMGYSNKITWNLNQITINEILYAVYDVYFLENFLKNIIDSSDNSIKYISPLTRLIFLEKINFLKIIKNIKNIVDSMNNFFIFYKNNKISLNNLYLQIIPNLRIKKLNIDILDLLSINYFKSIMTYIIKFILFDIINKKYTIFESKNVKFNKKLNIDLIFLKLKKLNSKRIINLFNNIHKIIYLNI